MTRIVLGPVELLPLAHICHHLRDIDAEEVLNGFATKADDLAAMTFASRGNCCRIVWHDSRPVAVVGAAAVSSGLYQAYAYGTDAWPYVVTTITRYIRRVMIPSLLDAGARRVQATSHANHHQAHRWMERLGAIREGMLRHYGRDGADYVLYAWTRADPDK